MSVPITPGSGLDVASDLVAGLHYQEIKWVIGPDGTVVPVSVGAGNISTGTPRFALATDAARLAKFDAAIAELQTVSNNIGVNTDPMEPNPLASASVKALTAGLLDALITLRDATVVAYNDSTPAPVVAPSVSKLITPVLSTSPAYGIDDILFNFVEVLGVARVAGGIVTLDQIHVLDEDNQKQTCDLYIADSAISFGTINTPTTIMEANLRSVRAAGGPVASGGTHPLRILAADYQTVSSAATQTKSALGVKLKAAVGQTSFWVGGLTRGTPSHAVDGLRFILDFTQD